MSRVFDSVRSSCQRKNQHMKILIVEDLTQSRWMLRALLETQGHTIIETGDGLEALAVLEREPVDDVISDIFMPNMDGYLLCYEVRRSERLRVMPFIFYTGTFTLASDRKLGHEVGADVYVTKPARLPVLLKALADAQRKASGRRGAPKLRAKVATMSRHSPSR